MATCDFVLHDTQIYIKVAPTRSVVLHNIIALN